MSQAFRIEPDTGFIKGLKEAGGDTLTRCYQCATCSVACPLSPPDAPYPRKEMVWAQWGLKDRLMTDVDVWLCHNCGTCSDMCPRGAKPADVLAAVRNMSYRELVQPAIIGEWMASPKHLPKLAGIPAAIFLVIWIIRAMFVGAFPRTEDGDIVYGLLFPGDYTIDPVFTLTAAFVAFTFYRGVKRLWSSFKEGKKTFHVGPHETPGLWRSVKDVVTGEIGPHSKWKECGEQTEADKAKFQGHFLTFYAFLALLIVTSVVAVAHWGGKVVPFLAPIGHTPMHLLNPVKILANVGAVALVAGLWFLTRRRLAQDPKVHGSSWYDWHLLAVIWVVTLTGVGAQVLRLMGWSLGYLVYYVHLVSVFMLIAYLPWSKLGHLVYRTVAVIYARHTGRLPLEPAEPKTFRL